MEMDLAVAIVKAAESIASGIAHAGLWIGLGIWLSK